MMTNAEAIETLRANYPDACYEQLRCAVDMAIKALTAQAKIVRCKDCIFHGLCRTSPKWAVAPKDDWYCADAERRIDEQTV